MAIYSTDQQLISVKQKRKNNGLVREIDLAVEGFRQSRCGE